MGQRGQNYYMNIKHVSKVYPERICKCSKNIKISSKINSKTENKHSKQNNITIPSECHQYFMCVYLENSRLISITCNIIVTFCG